MMSTLLLVIILIWLGLLTGLLLYIGQKIRSRFLHLDKQLAQLSGFIHSKVANDIIEALDKKAQEIQNTVSFGHMGFRFPLFLGGWSIDSFSGKFLVQHLLENPPHMILELGSGSSTLLIAKCMELIGHEQYHHIAVDHESRYLDLTRKFLRLNNLEQKVDYWVCPLHPIEGMNKLWYSGLIEKLDKKTIDLLIVDGPPGKLQVESRYPALPLLYPFLMDTCTVILDDTTRADEIAIVKKWTEAYPEFNVEIIKLGHGMAVLRRQKTI